MSAHFYLPDYQKYNDPMKPPDQLETERLVLRKPCLEDALVPNVYIQDLEVTPYTAWRPHQRPEETEDFTGSTIVK